MISEAANTGAMSDEQIDANQLQLDSSLEAIDRIAQVTQFQGKRLLDGNLDFVTDGVSSSQITDLKIEQANFGTLDEIDVSVDVVAQAEKAELQYAANTVTDSDGVVLEVGGTQGFEAFSFATGSSVAAMADAINLVSDALGVEAVVGQVRATSDGTGSMTATSHVDDANIDITADTAGRDGGDIAVKFEKGAAGATSSVAYTANADGTDELAVTLGTSDWATANANGIAFGAAAGTIDLDANMPGEQYNGVNVVVDDIAAVTASATYDHVNKEIHVSLASGSNQSDDLASIINSAAMPGVSSLFTATANNVDVVAVDTGSAALANGSDGGVLSDDAATIAPLIGAAGNDSEGYVTGALPTGTTGSGTVQPFQMATYYGTENVGRPTDTNDYLQFLGPDGLRTIPVRFVKEGADQSLSVTLDEKVGFTGKSSVVVQDSNADASFKVTAVNSGTEYDGATIDIVDVGGGSGANDYATWNPQTKTLTVGVDAADASATNQHIVDLINNDPIVGKYWNAEVFGSGAAAQIDGAGTYGVTTTGGAAPYTGITVHLATDANGDVTTTASDLVTYANTTPNPFAELGISVSNGGTSDGSGTLAPTTSDLVFATNGQTLSDTYAEGVTYNRGGEDAQMRVRALTPGGDYDDVRIVFADTLGAGNAGNETFSYNATDKTLTIGIESGASQVSDVLARFTQENYPTEYALFNITAVNGTGGVLYDTDEGVLSGGVTTGGTDRGVLLLGNHDEGDYIGSDGLRFVSTEYGSKSFVSVKALQGTFAVTDADGTTTDRDYGADVNVRINGIQAIGDGLKATINTSVLDMNFSLDESVEADTTIDFTIQSGGAQFQLGPEVVSNQQARLGISSLNTVKLGGTSGRLFQLRSGGDYDLKTDVLTAATVVNDVINQVTTLRGRLGAFQRTTLQTNINSLNDTLEALTDAESSIRDADFAAESARLTRAQILVQSGISVLSIANSNPQNVLALLQ